MEAVHGFAHRLRERLQSVRESAGDSNELFNRAVLDVKRRGAERKKKDEELHQTIKKGGELLQEIVHEPLTQFARDVGSGKVSRDLQNSWDSFWNPDQKQGEKRNATGLQELLEPYRHVADAISPQLEAAMSGNAVIEQIPPGGALDKEAIFAWTLYHFRTASPNALIEFLWEYDAIGKEVPTAREVIWAFSRLKARGWISKDEHWYSLTNQGLQEIQRITGDGEFWAREKRLAEWCLGHSP